MWGETTCDGKRKMFELMNELKETYVMQLPHLQRRRSASVPGPRKSSV
ncbi:2-hydroxyacyl-CoA dehydratase [Dialister sp.]